LEKKKLPRFKLCGGCLSARVVSLLPEGWQGLVKAVIREGTLGYRGEESFSLSSEKPLAYIVDRAEFDYFLVQNAQQVGVELWQECELLGFEERERIKVYTSKGEVEADFLIGADRFYSKTADLLGYKFQRSSYNWGKKEALKVYYRLLRGEEGKATKGCFLRLGFI